MFKRFFDVFKARVPAEHENAFHLQLTIYNAQRLYVICLLAVFFCVPLLFLDYERVRTEVFFESNIYFYSFLMHLGLALFIIPLLLLNRYTKEIEEGKYKHANKIIIGSVSLMGAVLIPMSVFANIDRKSLIVFMIYMILVNLFLMLRGWIRTWINIISLAVLIAGIIWIQMQAGVIMTATLIEAFGTTIPIFIIGIYLYRFEIHKFLDEKLLEKQNAFIQETMEDEFKRTVAEIEMKALRAQMNPHFLFNVLNSIKLYMVQNDAVTASAYLTKFSRLIRLILNNSKSKMVVLRDELEALKLYIEMENFRFNDKFDYRVKIAEDVEADLIEIPPLILQPYVENAIWHGLMHKSKGRGMLDIEVERHNGNIQFIIRDNGIGREKAQVIKTFSATKHESVGMKITEDRIEMTNQLYGTNASVSIEDMREDGSQTSSGTKVIITLPTN